MKALKTEFSENRYCQHLLLAKMYLTGWCFFFLLAESETRRTVCTGKENTLRISFIPARSRAEARKESIGNSSGGEKKKRSFRVLSLMSSPTFFLCCCRVEKLGYYTNLVGRTEKCFRLIKFSFYQIFRLYARNGREIFVDLI